MNTFERGIDPKQAMHTGLKNPIIDRAKEIIVNLCGDDIDYSKTFKDNELDILDYIEIIMYFEKEWDIQFIDENILPSVSINTFLDQMAMNILNKTK